MRAGALTLTPTNTGSHSFPGLQCTPIQSRASRLSPAASRLSSGLSPTQPLPSRRRGAALQGLACRQRCHHPQVSSRPAPALTQGPSWAETQPRHAAALGAELPAEGSHPPTMKAQREHTQRDQHSHPVTCPSPPRLGPQSHEEKAVRPEQGQAPRARGPRPAAESPTQPSPVPPAEQRKKGVMPFVLLSE